MSKNLFGLSLSLNRDWSWCPDGVTTEPPDVKAVLGSFDQFEHDPSALDHEIYYSRPWVRVYRMASGHFHLSYSDQTEFILDREGREIHARWPDSCTLEDTLLYLQGPVLGFALRLRGVTCLHASAVAVEERAIAVVGDAGMGKSTTAAAFARQGLAILTDDVLALSDRGTSFEVQPGLPRILLWPESAEALWGDREALPRIVPTWSKLFLDLTQPGYRFCSEPLSLGAVYVLGDRNESGSKPMIEPLGGTSALIHLVANTYANYLLDSGMRTKEIEALGRLVNHVPMRLLRVPEDRGAVSIACEAMLADFREITGG